MISAWWLLLVIPASMIAGGGLYAILAMAGRDDDA